MQVSPNSDPRYQGYVARLYTYFNHDSYFSKLDVDKNHITNTLLSLWLTFMFLNLFIPTFLITRGKQIFQRLTKIVEASNQCVYRAVVLTIILFNVVYTALMVITYLQGHPNVNLKCLHDNKSCSIPRTTISFDYIVGTLIAKAIILPIALLIELVLALNIARGSFSEFNCTRTIQFACCIQVFVIWQLFAFIQITIGLISIPWLVLMLISPVSTLSTSGGLVLICIVISFMIIAIPIPKFHKTQCKEYLLSTTVFVSVETFVMAAFVCSAYIAYYIIVNDGMNMNGVKGYIISLLPTVPISIFVWVIKKKFLEERINNKKELSVNTCKEEINQGQSEANQSLTSDAEMTVLLHNSETD